MLEGKAISPLLIDVMGEVFYDYCILIHQILLHHVVGGAGHGHALPLSRVYLTEKFVIIPVPPLLQQLFFSRIGGIIGLCCVVEVGAAALWEF